MQNLKPVLSEIERELSRGEAELSRLTARVADLRKAAEGLRGLVADESASHDQEAPSKAPVDGQLEAAPSSPLAFREIPDSFEAVRMILKAHTDQAVPIDVVRKEFRARSWVPPDWSKPDAAIYMALMRAQRRDEHIVRPGKRTWMYKSDPEQSAEDSPAEQEALG